MNFTEKILFYFELSDILAMHLCALMSVRMSVPQTNFQLIQRFSWHCLWASWH